MNFRTTVHGLVAATGLLALTPTPSARACTGSTCAPDLFLPFSGNVPANTFGIQWWPGKREGVGGDTLHETEASDLTFRCGVDPSAMHDVAFDVSDASTVSATIRLIVPSTPLVVGEQCEIALKEELGSCSLGIVGGEAPAAHLSERATFTVTEAIDQPSSLGTLLDGVATAHNTTLATTEGSCRNEVAVCGVALELQLDPSIGAWADSLIFTTYVDGERWGAQADLNAPNPTGGSFVGRGKDLVFLKNLSTEGAGISGRGLHVIEVHANLVGTDTDLALETAPIAVDIDCTGMTERDAGLDADAGADAGSNPRIEDAGPGLCDGHISCFPDRGGIVVDDGCGCSVVRPTHTTRATWLMLVVIGAFATRRVRSSRVAWRARAGRG